MSRTPDAIPRFRRYGEQTGDAELQPVHVEPIPVRSRLHNWEIRPHRHDGLHHLFLMTAGGGLVSIDGVQRGFRAPALVVVPAPMVHGFSYQPDSDGQVLTALEPVLAGVPAGLMEPPMLAAIRTPSVIGLNDRPEELESLRQGFVGIERELRSTAPGRTGAVAAHLVLILVTIARLDLAGDADAARPSRMGRARTPGPAALVDRFRQAIDRHFGEHWTVGAYARALGVTESRLNTACRRVAG